MRPDPRDPCVASACIYNKKIASKSDGGCGVRGVNGWGPRYAFPYYLLVVPNVPEMSPDEPLSSVRSKAVLAPTNLATLRLLGRNVADLGPGCLPHLVGEKAASDRDVERVPLRAGWWRVTSLYSALLTATLGGWGGVQRIDALRSFNLGTPL